MEAQQNFSVRESQTIYRTVVDVDMVGYSTTARLLEQNMGSSAVADLNRQIQDLVQSALRHMPSPNTYSKLKETGDGILLLFEAPQDAHIFAEQLHLNAKKHNRGRTDETAQRRFRIGIATGEVTRETQDAETRYAGIAIADAVRLEGAAEPGEIVMDLPTFAILPEQDRKCYGSETTVHGKRSEVYQVRKYKVTTDNQSPIVTKESLTQKEDKPPRQWTRMAEIATVLAFIVAVLTFYLTFGKPKPAPPVANSALPVLQRVQANPNSVSKGDRVTVTVELSKPAPSGGVSVNLSSTDPAILTVDGNAIVHEGDTTGTAYSKVVSVPNYLSPVQIVAAYNNQPRRADVNIIASTSPSYPTPTPRIASGPTRTPASSSRTTPPDNTPAKVPAVTLPTPLDPELISRLEEAQGRLSAENSYWEGVKTHMPAGSSLRPEITSQIYAAESASRRCSKERQASDASSLTSCIDSLNDHLNQLHIQH